MTGDQKRIALLIDAENASTSNIDVIVEEVGRRGTATVRRAYGDWTSLSPGTWKETLHEHAIRPVQQFAYTAGKNASDIAMVIDAVDLLHAHNFDAFAIVSSDADFTPLVMRIRDSGVKVYGFGEAKTPPPFVRACSQFTYLGELGKTPAGPKHAAPKHAVSKTAEPKKTVNISEPPKTPKAGNPKDLSKESRLVQVLRKAVKDSKKDTGWSHLGEIGALIEGDESFDMDVYGPVKLSKVVEDTGLFEVDWEAPGVRVRALGKK
ncbi:NYN domain-containing protein [Arthrobacter sp. H14]|uniref:NYN domain-containing protein n=1 Tax=Arthrobacter sp. H14 TaxID=1312959 RepID=UPI0004786E6C|nr:NYN domain-containing protein [Arthrobacter sp. H14]